VSGLQILPMLDEGLGNQSYLVTLGDGRAVVVDPTRDPSPYIDAARRLGVGIAYSLETHLHADFISGSRELAALGSTIVAPTAAQLAADYQGLADGEELDLGGLKLRALATPGHTPEHLSYLLLDGSRPVALFSGGALLPGSAARTDLISPDQTESLARDLYRSVRQHFADLPDSLPVYPTHGAGSFCSTGASGDRTTTLGMERLGNLLFAPIDEDTFVRAFLDGRGTYPAYFLRLRDVNRRGAALYGTHLPDPKRLSLADFRDRLAGSVLIDTRPFTEFAAGHIRGALSDALRPSFVSWLGWLVPAGSPLLFVMGSTQDRRELVRQCLEIGYENLVGELDGGMAAWREAGLPVSTIKLRQPDEDLDQIALDVRQASEWGAGHVPGARHVELGSLAEAAAQLPNGPMTVYCGHGERAMSAASLLEARGRTELSVLEGGFDAWSERGRPTSME
jgi:hydroxyacylglutathione hydrolase